MTRAVADTNVIISAIFWSGKPYQVILRGLKGNYQLVTSPEIIDEVTRKLRDKFHFPEDRIDEQVNIMLTMFHVVSPTIKLNVVRDKSDNKIIECAVAGNADFIVTGDPDLLSIGTYKEVKILTPDEFLKMLDKK